MPFTYKDLFQAAGNIALWSSYAIIRAEKKEKEPSPIKTALTVGVIGISVISSMSKLKILLQSTSPRSSELPIPLTPISINAFGQTFQIRPRVSIQSNGNLSCHCNDIDLSQIAATGIQGYNLYNTAKRTIPQMIECSKQGDTKAIACAAVHLLNLGSDAVALGIMLDRN